MFMYHFGRVNQSGDSSFSSSSHADPHHHVPTFPQIRPPQTSPRRRTFVRKGRLAQMEIEVGDGDGEDGRSGGGGGGGGDSLAPGDVVRGKVDLEVQGTLRFRSLSIVLRGLARVSWQKDGGGGILRSKDSEVLQEITYVNEKRYLLGGMGSGARERLPEGTHSFAFSLRLPENQEMATSFEGEHGCIRYYLRAELDEYINTCHKILKPLNVVCPSDVSREEFMDPVRVEKERRLGGLFRARDDVVHATVATDRKGYCPGDKIVVSGTFHNVSSRSLRPDATLFQVQSYFDTVVAPHPSSRPPPAKTHRRPMSQARPAPPTIPSGSDGRWGRGGGGGGGGEEEEEGDPPMVTLQVPAGAVPSFDRGLVRIGYEVQISFHAPGQRSAPSLVLPVVVGTSGNPETPLEAVVDLPDRQLPSPPSYYESFDQDRGGLPNYDSAIRRMTSSLQGW